jgi:hypothetical protein
MSSELMSDESSLEHDDDRLLMDLLLLGPLL